METALTENKMDTFFGQKNEERLVSSYENNHPVMITITLTG